LPDYLTYLKALEKELRALGVHLKLQHPVLRVSQEQKQIDFLLAGENAVIPSNNSQPILDLDQAITQPQKMAALIRSKLGLNKTVFARQCGIQKIDKPMATQFLDQYHLLNSTQSAYNFGLFFNQELIAVASFSKGRKMDRLPEDRRSFELIRFCCKAGITVTGGLTKLVKNFAIEKNAGDIMTYVDKQLSDGRSFMRAGFKKLGESQPVGFLIDKSSFERHYYTGGSFDQKRFYLAHNFGNLKLVYTLHEPA
jgi:hypothetical protein